MGETSSPFICFIIVNWNKRDSLKNCLASIQSNISKFPYKILVVDNASTDGSLGMVQQNFPDVCFLRNEKNIGFARANNQALQYLKKTGFHPDYIAFLNNDTLLADNSIERIFEFMEKRKNIVAAIPAVFLRNSSFQTGIGGFDLSLTSAFFYSFFFSKFLPQAFKGFFFEQNYFFKKKKCCQLDWLSGVCLIVRRRILDETEGFPEEYFMYAEDLALGHKLRNKGALVYFPQSRILHLKDDQDRSHWNVVWLESLFRYYRQNQKEPFLSLKIFILKGLFLTGFFLRAAGYSMLSLVSNEKFILKRNELIHYAKYVMGIIFANE